MQTDDHPKDADGQAGASPPDDARNAPPADAPDHAAHAAKAKPAPANRGRRSWRQYRLTLAVFLLAFFSIFLAAQGRSAMLLLDEQLTRLDRAERHLRWRYGLSQRGMPDLSRLGDRLAQSNVSEGAPILVRIFKQESQLELWLKQGDRFVLFTTYPICRWSGDIGPKLREGDKQSPEGFYSVSAQQLNPNSRWHRSFNVGFPNAFDRSFGRTGSFIMVHGGCSSVGCYAVTNEAVDEIWRLVTAALKGGQSRFQVQVYPFRMTNWNLDLHRGNEWHGFWRNLKTVHDQFERDHVPPDISVCEQRYQARPGEPGSDGDGRIEERCGPRVIASGPASAVANADSQD